MPIWKHKNREIHGWELWGEPLWEEIWDIIQCTNVPVLHVDTHTKKDSPECEYNATAGAPAKIAAATTSEDDCCLA